ncbi:MerR family transcriptional regulator [Xylanimonas oleitrophica]|uniref:MerR family transcriptional regulator n=1 Tax=Xylanimonas oleitrophica TaxID=2607479 RepID=UPI001FE318B6|nr:MerR family transcriptional regulator [Xylanimonas oleitrophica]
MGNRHSATRANLSTAEVSAATGWSPQQVRDLEAHGVLPPAQRAPNGYRRFSPEHLRDLHTYRDLASAVGPVQARRTMRQIRAMPTADAVAHVCDLHARLNQEREQALAARHALTAISTEATTDSSPADGDTMTITELAGALGVRASTLRFWEREGLVHPERVPTSAGTARRYPAPAIREARITTALRAAGYRIPEVRHAITAVRELQEVSRSLAALDERLALIAQRSLALLRAGAALAEIVRTTGENP